MAYFLMTTCDTMNKVKFLKTFKYVIIYNSQWKLELNKHK